MRDRRVRHPLCSARLSSAAPYILSPFSPFPFFPFSLPSSLARLVFLRCAKYVAPVLFVAADFLGGHAQAHRGHARGPEGGEGLERPPAHQGPMGAIEHRGGGK